MGDSLRRAKIFRNERGDDLLVMSESERAFFRVWRGDHAFRNPPAQNPIGVGNLHEEANCINNMAWIRWGCDLFEVIPVSDSPIVGTDFLSTMVLSSLAALVLSTHIAF